MHSFEHVPGTHADALVAYRATPAAMHVLIVWLAHVQMPEKPAPTPHCIKQLVKPLDQLNMVSVQMPLRLSARRLRPAQPQTT